MIRPRRTRPIKCYKFGPKQPTTMCEAALAVPYLAWAMDAPADDPRWVAFLAEDAQ